MDEHAIEDALSTVLNGGYGIENTALAEVVEVQSFFDAGLLTTERGLVLLMSDGSEFQITIVQSL